MACIKSLGFTGGSDGKESACSAGDPGWIPGLGRCPGGGNGNPLQYSFLENPMDGGAWHTTVHRVTKSWTKLSDFTSLSLKNLQLGFLFLLLPSTINSSSCSHSNIF